MFGFLKKKGPTKEERDQWAVNGRAKQISEVNRAEVARTMNVIDALIRQRWGYWHSQYMADLAVIGETAIDPFIFWMIDSAWRISKTSQLEGADDFFISCFVMWLADQKGGPTSSTGREWASTGLAVRDIALLTAENLRAKGIKNEFGLQMLLETVYRNFNRDAVLPSAMRAEAEPLLVRSLDVGRLLFNFA